ncbi:MAG: hypothetical protein AAFQ68_24460 [Bacteroidota bacterium]
MRILSFLCLLTVSLIAVGSPSPSKAPVLIMLDQDNPIQAMQTNQVSESIQIEYTIQDESNSMLEVVLRDEEGQVIARRLVAAQGDTLRTQISVNRWPEGSYQLSVFVAETEERYPLQIIKPEDSPAVSRRE